MKSKKKLLVGIRHVNECTLAAAIVLLGWMLALSQRTEAKIFYTKTEVSLAYNTPYNLDLNNDGITDFSLLTTFKSWGSCGIGPLSLT